VVLATVEAGGGLPVRRAGAAGHGRALRGNSRRAAGRHRYWIPLVGEMLKPRLSAGFRFGLMVLVGGLAVVAITPFVVYRFATGNHLAAVIDIGIQVAIVSIVAYASRSGNM